MSRDDPPAASDLLAALHDLAGVKAERDALRERLRESEAARDEAFAMLAHELRTPLHALGMTNELVLTRLRAGTATPPEWLLSKSEQSKRAIARLRQLVDVVLGFSQVRAGSLPMQLETFDLREVVIDVVERETEELAWAGCSCAVQAPAPQVGRWDRAHLDLVVANLVSNARTYGRGRPISVCVDGDDAHARIAVEDRGIGIAPEHQGRLFQRFERLPSGREATGVGLGLGLWIVKELVTLAGGFIAVRSAAGEGATFSVTVPKHLGPRG